MFRRMVQHVHFVGIGGIGMSGIAEVLLNLGYQVSGSDLRSSDTTERLEKLGGVVSLGHDAGQVADADVVVVSSAVSEDNPEVVEARRRKIPVIPRAEMLAELMRLKFGVAVAGTHGKTTTTSLLATVLSEAGLDPTLVIGGKLNSIGTNARLGQSDILVAEADESDGSFLFLSPVISIITNIDPEHLDHYGSLEKLEDAFVAFADKVPFYGSVVLCLDHPRVQALLPRIHKRCVTYGFSAQADYRADEVRHEGLGSSFQVIRRGEPVGRISLKMPGRHNVLNALAVVAVADALGVEFEVVSKALGRFQGVQRRFTIRADRDGLVVVDDYGHHPAEIQTTLAAARQSFPKSRILALFQPHRYSRVQRLWEEFARAFNQADLVFVCDIYPAGEQPIEGISASRLAEEISRCGHRGVRYIGGLDAAKNLVEEIAAPGDLVITLGAGDVWKVGQHLAHRLDEGLMRDRGGPGSGRQDHEGGA